MLLDKHETRYKEYLKAEKRLRQVEQEIRNIPYQDLKEPYKNGWIVSLELREDIARREDAELIRKIVSIGTTRSYLTTSVRWVKAIRRGERSIIVATWKGRISISLIPAYKHIHEKEYDALTPQEAKYFYLDTYYMQHIRSKRKLYMLSLPDYWLKLKVRPFIVTQAKEAGGPLEAEKAELRTFLQPYWRTFSNGGYGKYPAGSQRTMTRMAIGRLMKDIEDEDIELTTPIKRGWN